MIKCKKCGKELPDDSIFCQFCGSNEIARYEEKKVMVKKCSNCQKELSMDSAFCMFCGSSAIEEEKTELVEVHTGEKEDEQKEIEKETIEKQKHELNSGTEITKTPSVQDSAINEPAKEKNPNEEICEADYKEALRLIDSDDSNGVKRAIGIMQNLTTKYKYIPAMLWLAGIYEEVLNDFTSANILYKLAADLGSAEGARCYADNVFAGKGAKPDEWVACTYYRKASKGGNAQASFVLGELYKREGDKPVALEFYKKAYEQGFEPASERIKQVEKLIEDEEKSYTISDEECFVIDKNVKVINDDYQNYKEYVRNCKIIQVENEKLPIQSYKDIGDEIADICGMPLLYDYKILTRTARESPSAENELEIAKFFEKKLAERYASKVGFKVDYSERTEKVYQPILYWQIQAAKKGNQEALALEQHSLFMATYNKTEFNTKALSAALTYKYLYEDNFHSQVSKYEFCKKYNYKEEAEYWKDRILDNPNTYFGFSIMKVIGTDRSKKADKFIEMAIAADDKSYYWQIANYYGVDEPTGYKYFKKYIKLEDNSIENKITALSKVNLYDYEHGNCESIASSLKNYMRGHGEFYYRAAFEVFKNLNSTIVEQNRINDEVDFLSTLKNYSKDRKLLEEVSQYINAHYEKPLFGGWKRK